MPVVERAHRGHEADAASTTVGKGLAHVRDGAGDDHVRLPCAIASRAVRVASAS